MRGYSTVEQMICASDERLHLGRSQGFKAVDDTTFLMVKVLCSGAKKVAA